MRPLIAASVFLILSVVLAGTMFGQVYGETNPVIRYDTTWGGLEIGQDMNAATMWMRIDASGIVTVFSIPPVTLLSLQSWKEYKAECYADSTLERLHNASYDPLRYCLVDWTCLVSSHYRDEWTHRTPTFEGWMDWLERKLQ